MSKIYDIADGIVRFAHTDKSDDRLVFASEQDVSAIIEQGKLLRENMNPKASMRHVAQVPLVIYERAVREGWADDEAAWTRWLNDPDNKAFRVYEGRV